MHLYANPQVHRITSTQLTGRFNTGLKCAQTKTPGVLFNHQGASKESTSLKDGMHLSRGSAQLKDLLPPDSEELFKRRAKELQQHKARTESVLSTRLYAPSNSPLQYPIQGFKVRPMTPTFIPGMLHRTVCPFITLHCDTTEGCV
ncbi:hypothetical protein F7725_004091 [Dissostichus mawsoni]|uniref:Uncharacterized protein n=1 Tax=Dissostichus mawsoni TaxID=36200 RepID=A0A7J5YCZ6_DISMA|nr:hypothetical protein F7725_004091 [Dissostichus mawsoni]